MGRKEALIGVVAILMTLVISGCTEEAKATIKDYKIMDYNERPAMEVYVDTNKFPISLELLGPDRKTIDMKFIESEKDLPAIVYFGLSGLNEKPGTYYLVLKIGAKTVEEKELKLQGPKLELVGHDFKFKHSELLELF